MEIIFNPGSKLPLNFFSTRKNGFTKVSKNLAKYKSENKFC